VHINTLLTAIVQARRFSLFGHSASMPVETDAKILTASPWRDGGDHQDALILHGWRFSSRTWNPITSLWMKQLTWLRITHTGDSETDVYVWHYKLLVVQEEDEEGHW